MNNFLKQSLMGLWKKVPYGVNSKCTFEDIVGHDDIKLIFVKAILSKRPVHLLLVGSPGSAKTMFLAHIMRTVKDSYFIIGSTTTKSGLIDVLFKGTCKFLLIDELDKMKTSDQVSLLNLMETGIISETKFGKTRQKQLTTRVFGTCNNPKKIIEPLLSRFVVLEVPEYTFEEFSEIALIRLARENVEGRIARVIAQRVWNELDSKDIRDVIKVARLASSSEDVPFVVKMLKKRITKSEDSFCRNDK